LELETILLFAVGLAAWFWINSLQAREIAVSAGREAAEKYGLQLLDETVAMARLRFARDVMGRLRLRRTYQFEVSDTGAERLACSLVLLGNRVEALEIPPHRDNVVRLY
jgi:hypothetical protein